MPFKIPFDTIAVKEREEALNRPRPAACKLTQQSVTGWGVSRISGILEGGHVRTLYSQWGAGEGS